ncbi:cbb3-type cytochrome c oxidase subunit 3 [Georhizobium sp. MAB10]|uniref:cbb3-type cytochrome c oxidase subunit 3 n=1 Tax=Georhizobium sp. MAB10 TaxID=3028319 RepID=UPI003855E8A7
MDIYTAMRAFADSWALLAMTLFFFGVVIFALRPGGRNASDLAAQIPLNDEHPEPRP